MPTEDMDDLDPEPAMRIFKMATSCRYLKSRTNVETASIMFEVQSDFHRTMNKIVMDTTLDKSEEELAGMIPANLQLAPKPKPRTVPQHGMVPIPPHDFPDSFSSFCFRSLYIKEEAIRAMVEIRTICNDLMKNNRIWDTKKKEENANL
jgi:hypothetical protein